MRLNPSFAAGFEKKLQPLMPEGFDHLLLYSVTLHKSNLVKPIRGCYSPLRRNTMHTVHRMILHCSQKLASRLSEVFATPLAEDSPLGGWHGHLFSLDRRQCVMFCHDATRFTLFMAGLRKEHFAEIGKWFRHLFAGTLAMSGHADAQISRALLALGPVRFDTTINRSVQGTMRIARWDLEALLHRVPNVMDLDPLAVSLHLCNRPVTVHGKSLWPSRAMQEVLENL